MMNGANRIKLNEEDIIITFFTLNISKDENDLIKSLGDKFNEKTLYNAVDALMAHWEGGKTFALIRVENLYCWIKHSGTVMQEYINEVYPFSEERIYPAQQIKREYNFI